MELNSFFILKTNEFDINKNEIICKKNKKIIKLKYEKNIDKDIKKYKYTNIIYDKFGIIEYNEIELIISKDDKIIVFAETEYMIETVKKDLQELFSVNFTIENINFENFIENNLIINRLLIKNKETYFIDAKLVKNYNEIKNKIIGVQIILEVDDKYISINISNKNKIKFTSGLLDREIIDMCRGLKLIV